MHSKFIAAPITLVFMATQVPVPTDNALLHQAIDAPAAQAAQAVQPAPAQRNYDLLYGQVQALLPLPVEGNLHCYNKLTLNCW